MARFTKAVLNIPEYLLIGAVTIYWFSTAILLNPVAIVLLIGLIAQVVFRNKISGILIPSLLIIISLYMILAVISEFNEFPYFNAEAKELLFVGLTIFLSTIALSGLMIVKYLKIGESNQMRLNS